MIYRFEKQKREQELKAAKHLDLGSDGEAGGSGSESDSETEDEDAEMLTPALDLQVQKKGRRSCCCTAIRTAHPMRMSRRNIPYARDAHTGARPPQRQNTAGVEAVPGPYETRQTTLLR